MINILDYVAIAEDTVQDQVVDTPVVETTESQVENVQAETEVAETPGIETPSEYEIDGEKYTLDDIREWRKGNMRQSDYTKKTTELANQRKEAQDALEVFNYLKNKPDLVQKLYEMDTENPMEVNNVKDKLDPVARQVQELNQKLLIKDIEVELNEITSKDKTVSDVELLQLANEMKCSVSVAYDLWKGKNMDKIMKQREAELKRKLADEIKTNANTTKTLINQTDKANDNGKFGLTDEQILFADKIGMSYEDYKNNMSNPW